MTVSEKEHPKSSDFISACIEDQVRLVKLATYAFVEPGPLGGGAYGMIGKETIVMTAFSSKNATLHRWKDTREARSMVTITAGTGRGTASAGSFPEEAVQIRARLELEGIQVVDGEWQKDDIERLIGK